MEIIVANHTHEIYAQVVCDLIFESALQRGTGIAKRSAEYIAKKMREGKAVVAIDNEQLVGFSYIETWEHQRFVANSGLIVDPAYRKTGLARKIKLCIFELSRTLYPDSKIFSITTGLAVMKLNSELGYVPVTFSELTSDETFWKGCEGCRNYDILTRNERKMCLCTGMLFDPTKVKKAADNQPEPIAATPAVSTPASGSGSGSGAGAGSDLLSPKRKAAIKKMMRKIHLF